ncbi:c-type cytochrome [Afifella sp. IM 167]|uniref:c-type cytochrome n=1 Tax=Afifella sp. IM 167 TaxID=2033586 RepID=UPI001CD00A76|nr:c-type cytochrome [Afifella sp. IM 167]MBZ8132013.1 cytochrome C [Afifella sp. IM 167]
MRQRRRGLGRSAGLALAALSCGSALAGGDPAEGEKVFSACRSCHQVGEGARHGIGPHLDRVFGREAGSLEGFAYSLALRRKGAQGLVWNAQTLDVYLKRPQAYVPGTRMSFRGMAGNEDRANLIAYLEAASAGAPAADPGAAPAPRDEIGALAMNIEGDPALGQYLANECVTCHQPSGRADGIPSIVGWPRVAFVRALFEYKTNVRAHEVMRMVTRNLGNDEIAALAAYFGSLTPQ